MRPEVVLCADTESVKSPDLIGLEGENLLSQSWLRLFCSAVEVRAFLRKAEGIREVWIASSDDMEPINLAAAIKKDTREQRVCLLAFDGGGSLKSRASAAGIDATLTKPDFAAQYGRRKRSYAHDRDDDCFQAADCRPPFSASEPTEPLRDLPTIAPAGGCPSAVSPCLNEGARATVQSSVADPASMSCGEFRATARKGSSEKSACTLSVVSASGGAGRSTVAVLAAFFSQGFGYKTLLLDADMQFGDMRYMAGVENPLTLDEVVADQTKLEKLVSDGRHPALLAAPKRLEQSEFAGESIARILEQASASFDVVIVNTSSHWDESLAQVLERSSHVLFLVDQRAVSLRAGKHALEMCSRCGIATTPFVFAVNRCAKNALFSSFDVACSLGGSHAVELKDEGKEVDELLGAGLPLDLIGSRNDLCLSLERVLIDILPGNPENPEHSTAPVPGRAKRFSLGRKGRRAACL